MNTQSGYVALGGDSVYFEQCGNGRLTIVLFHEGVANLRMWDDQADVFAERHRVVRYDFRNYGKSGYATSPYSAHEDAKALLDHLGVDRVALVGASMGGGVALDFALTYPDRVAALVPVAAGLDGFESPHQAALKARWGLLLDAYNSGDILGATEICTQTWFDGPKRRPEESDPAVRARAKAMMHEMILRPDPEVEIEPTPLNPSTAARLGEIAAPTLVIYADGDQPAIIDASEEIASKVPGAMKAVLHGPAHLPNMEMPAMFNKLVLDFIGSAA